MPKWFVKNNKINDGNIGMLRITLMIILMSVAPQVFSTPVPMVCTWSLWFDDLPENDTFIFDLETEKIYWVNEEKEIELDKINEGLIKWKGIPSSRVNIDKSKYKTHIPIKFTLNRITGELKVENEYTKSNINSKCVLKTPIL
jgi:hypothetical protein